MLGIIMCHKIFLLNKDFEIIGETNYKEINHLDKTKFAYFKIDNYIFKSQEIVKVFAELDINTGVVKDKFFEVKGIKWHIV